MKNKKPSECIKELAIAFLDEGMKVRICGDEKDILEVADAIGDSEFMIIYDNNEYEISFWRKTHPSAVNWAIEFLNKRKVKWSFYEGYDYDEKGNMIWPDHEDKEAEDSNEITEGA